MYPIAVVGDNLVARATLLACAKAGFEELTWVQGTSTESTHKAYTLPANLSRIVQALVGAAELSNISHTPDREQIRFGRSAYLLSELPLGQFCNDRYGAPHVNIEADELMKILSPPAVVQSEAEPSQLERTHSVVVHTAPALGNLTPSASHATWHASTPYDDAMGKANITWLGDQQVIWQFTTPQKSHFLMTGPAEKPWLKAHWHPSLHPALSQMVELEKFSIEQPIVREHWQEGHVVYAGDANFLSTSYRRESRGIGLEDAWVLSRMLENYEEDIGDGLREYAKYRRPRAVKLARDAATLAKQYNQTTPIKRALGHINTAFSTRFMPEIAMQRIDWFYNYDCIRGFR